MPMGNCGQRESEHRRNCMVGDSWFLSVKTAEASMNVAMSGLTLPKHHTVCSQERAREKVKTWPGGMSLVLEATTSKGFKLNSVGCIYNSSRFYALLQPKILG